MPMKPSGRKTEATNDGQHSCLSCLPSPSFPGFEPEERNGEKMWRGEVVDIRDTLAHHSLLHTSFFLHSSLPVTLFMFTQK